MSLRSHSGPIALENALVRIIVPDGAREVVVSFESAAPDINRKDMSRSAFGEKFLLDSNFAVVGIMPRSKNWYRTPDIHRFLESQELHDFLGEFERIHTYGASMGGYGACAFAGILGAQNVVALQPVSTLAAELVPWESRFRPGIRNDWAGPYKDGADGLAGIESVWLIYDSSCQDKPHVVRLSQAAGRAAREINVRGARHAVALALRNRGIIKAVALACLRCEPQVEVQRIVDMSYTQMMDAAKKRKKHAGRQALLHKAVNWPAYAPKMVLKMLKRLKKAPKGLLRMMRHLLLALKK
jgi:hypothetical protein